MRSRRFFVACVVATVLFCSTSVAFASFNNAKTAAGSVSTATLAAPTSLAATGTGAINLSWTATSSTFATGTRIMRGTVSGGPYSQIAQLTPRTTTTYVDTAPPGTYFYVAVAYYQQWTSANSNQVSKTRAAAALVQKATGGNTSGSFSATFTSTPVAGHLLVAIAGTRLIGTMTPPSGWSTAIDESGQALPNQAIYYKIAGASEPTVVTVTTTATGSGTGLQLYDYSGVTTLAATSSATATTGTAVSSGSVVVAPAYSLVIAGLTSQAGASFSGYTNGFTEQADFTGGSGGGRTLFAGADITNLVSGTFSTTATSTASGNWRGQIVAFT